MAGLTALCLTRFNAHSTAVSAHLLAGEYNDLFIQYQLVEEGFHPQSLIQHLFYLKHKERELEKQQPRAFSFTQKRL